MVSEILNTLIIRVLAHAYIPIMVVPQTPLGPDTAMSQQMPFDALFTETFSRRE
jgi:hypothetical protein